MNPGQVTRTDRRRQAPLGKRLRRRVEAAAFFGLLGLFRRMDPDRASQRGGWFGRRMLAPLLRSKRTYQTIATAFPELDRDGATELIDGMAESIGRTLGELEHLEFFLSDAGKARFTTEGLEHLEAAKRLGKPLLFTTGHFGNFELGLAALHHVGIQIAAVARKPNNVAIGDYFERRRAATGLGKLFDKGPDGTRQMVQWLKDGGNVAMFVDQHLAEGIPAPLFGQEAMTTHTPATLALSHDVTLLPGALRREGDGTHFRLVFYPPILPPHSGNAARDILAMTAEMNRFVEAEVRANPKSWLWMHPRFKPVDRLSRRARRLLEDAAQS